MREVKLMELAEMIYDGEMYDFAAGTVEEVEMFGGWFGIEEHNPFDNDSLIYLVGGYGGEANTCLYTISEYDPRIGDFCYRWVGYGRQRNRQAFVNCIGRMLVDLFDRYYGKIPEVITIDD